MASARRAIADEGVAVCPFGGQGAIAPFNLAVLPWTVGLDGLLLCSEFGAGALHVGGVAVGKDAAGQDPLDASGAGYN